MELRYNEKKTAFNINALSERGEKNMAKIEKPMTENQKYYGNKLYKFLKEKGDFATKDEMFDYLGWDKSKDRQLRDLLSLLGQKVPLISMSSDRG